MQEADQHRQINLMRNALVLAARKCQALEGELKRANETIKQLHLDHSTNEAGAGARAIAPTNNTPEELEDLLAKLHGLSASSAVSIEERNKLQAYIVDRLQATNNSQQEVALKESRRGEDMARQELETAKQQIEALKVKLSLVSSRNMGTLCYEVPISQESR